MTTIAAFDTRARLVDVRIRRATFDDVPAINELIQQSVRTLNAQDYDQRRIDSALRYVIRIDLSMIADGTYYVAEVDGQIVGYGGCSRRGISLYGGSAGHTSAGPWLDPATDAAKIRTFFVHPQWVRRGIGGNILRFCERAARRAGFTRLELLATLTGRRLYTVHGFQAIADEQLSLPDGVQMPAVKMLKHIA